MTKRQKAIKGSIRKWQRILKGKGIDKGQDNCALCEEYYDYAEGCVACPIYKKTGVGWCNGTPHALWCCHQNTEHNSGSRLVEDCDECKVIAEAEILFLKSLLRKGGVK